jgi:mevalonate pyrophosphate decarboxylase
LKWHVIVDPYYLSKAETDLKRAMEGYIIEHPKYDEIVGMKEKVVNSTIHHIYKNIGKHYAGRLKEIQHQMEKMRLEKDFEIRHSEELRQKDEKHFHEILKQKDEIIDLHKELLQAYREKK